MMKNHRIQHFVGVFMTLLMVSYLACLSLCLHTHVVDSKVITHSHPYKTSSHSHSGVEITLLKSLSDFSTLLSDENSDITPCFALLCEFSASYSVHVESFLLTLSSLRAPPYIQLLVASQQLLYLFLTRRQEDKKNLPQIVISSKLKG